MPEGQVEASVKVWLAWDRENKRWAIDSPTTDGSPLYSADECNGPYLENGREEAERWHARYRPLEPGESLDDLHTLADLEEARGVDLPTAAELVALLNDALDYRNAL